MFLICQKQSKKKSSLFFVQRYGTEWALISIFFYFFSLTFDILSEQWNE